MSISTDADRRQDTRKKEEIFCPVSFEVRGRRIQAVLVDISKAGAQFKAYEIDASLNLQDIGEIEYIINTNLGSAVCRARTKWVRSGTSEIIWGVEFTSISTSPEDPLHQLLSAMPALDRSAAGGA
jgi:hypothetical protein